MQEDVRVRRAKVRRLIVGRGFGQDSAVTQRAEESGKPADLPAGAGDSISYLMGVARGKFKPEGLNSLENNVIVTEILEAARESVRTSKKIVLSAR